MWCSASSCTASRSSLTGTSGIWTFLMINSRPDTPMAASLDPTAARPTASLMASTTLGGSLIVPSAIASRGHQHRERHGLVAGRNASGGEGTVADRDRALPHSGGCDARARCRGAVLDAHGPGVARVRRRHAGLVTEGDVTRGQRESSVRAILGGRHRRRGHRPDAHTVVVGADRKSTRLNSSHSQISYAVFCLKKKKKRRQYDVAVTSIRSTRPQQITVMTRPHLLLPVTQRRARDTPRYLLSTM